MKVEKPKSLDTKEHKPLPYSYHRRTVETAGEIAHFPSAPGGSNGRLRRA